MDLTADWMAIVIAAILNMVISFIWYSKWLFGAAWMKLCSMKDKDRKGSKKALFWAFIVSLVIAYFLDFFESNLDITTVSDGMVFGFFIWLGFVATTQIGAVLWCREPWRLFAINTGCKLLSFLVMSGVIGA